MLTLDQYMKTNNLTLDQNHIYWLGDKQVDGSTSIIKEAGLIRDIGDPWYLRRGSGVHLATELWDRETLDESTVDERIGGYLESWKRFRRDQHYIPIEIEIKLYDPIYQYAGTIDRLPHLDVKSGNSEKWHVWQLASYWNLCRINGFEDLCKTPLNIYLDERGGSPRVKNYPYLQMKQAFDEFCCILKFVRIKRNAT